MKIFLDDNRTVDMVFSNQDLSEWTVLKTHDEFVEYITENGLPEFISFDHDLADEHYDKGIEAFMSDNDALEIPYDEFKEKTGMESAKWLVNYCIDNKKRLPEFYVHSANPAGNKNIKSYLTNFKNFQLR